MLSLQGMKTGRGNRGIRVAGQKCWLRSTHVRRTKCQRKGNDGATPPLPAQEDPLGLALDELFDVNENDDDDDDDDGHFCEGHQQESADDESTNKNDVEQPPIDSNVIRAASVLAQSTVSNEQAKKPHHSDDELRNSVGNLGDLKVADLRVELKARCLPV